MPFVLNRFRSASDPDTDSHLVIRSTPEIDYHTASFQSPVVSMNFGIELRCKIPYKVFVDIPENPCVMLRAEDFNDNFAECKMLDFNEDTKIAERIVRMIAFIHKHSRRSRSSFLWSNAQSLRLARWLYRVPSDDELLQISIEPEGGAWSSR